MVSDPASIIFDVVVVDATGRPADCSQRLQAELLRHDLCVKLEIVPVPSEGDMLAFTAEYVRRAACSS